MHGLLKNTWNPKGAGCTLCKSFTATYSLGKCLVNFVFGLHDYPILPGFCIELWAASLRHSKGTRVELVLGWCGAWQGGKEHSTHQCYGDSPSLQRCMWELGWLVVVRRIVLFPFASGGCFVPPPSAAERNLIPGQVTFFFKLVLLILREKLCEQAAG